MKTKKLIVIIALLSAVCLTLSACLYWFINIKSMSRLLPEEKNITEEEKTLLEDIGEPDWKSYIITYFLMLFTLIGVIAIWFAVANPGMRGSTVAMIMQIFSLMLLVLIFKNILDGKSKFLYGDMQFKLVVLLMLLSFGLLILYSLLMFKNKTDGKQKEISEIAKDRKDTKIVVLDKCTLTVGDIDFSPLDVLGKTRYFDILTKEQIIENCKDANVILCNKAVIDKEIMENCPELKYIGLFATGYNNIDLQAASEHGITVCNAPGYSTDSVAQLVFAYILNHTTSLNEYNESTHNGEWIRSSAFSYFPYPINELNGKTLSVIGYGAIGKKVAKIGAAFGMNVCVATRTKPENCPYQLVSVDDAFKAADYLTVHCPLTSETEKLINADRLRKMKKTAYVINTARGAVADEYALREALDKGIIAGAACDVLKVEPMRENDPLIGAKNLTLTPHIAWASYEARVRLISLVASNLKSYQNGIIKNKVNG